MAKLTHKSAARARRRRATVSRSKSWRFIEYARRSVS